MSTTTDSTTYDLTFEHLLTVPADRLLTTQYATDVISGKIIASQKVHLACLRHMKDLARSKTDEFPYRFDETIGHRPVVFIERYCKPSKGVFDRLVMQLWQHFIIGSLYGWVHKETGLRRFDEGLIFVARKNGKSAIVTGLSLFGASKDGENGADIYILANSMKQARKVIYEECQKMVRESPALKKRFRVLRDAIYYDAGSATIEPQASDSEKLDGLNCHLGLFDEIHEYKNYKLINVVKNSTDARQQPLILYITTAGFVLDGPLMDYYERGADVLEEVIEDDRTFYYLAELDPDDVDEIDNVVNWPKANPNVGVTIQMEKLIQNWGKRRHIPAERNDFITKRLNVFVQSDEQSFVTLEIIKRNNGFIDPESVAGHVCVGGYDLSSSEDFTAACIEFPLADGRVFLLSHTFIPEKKVLLDNENMVDQIKDWEKEGHLTIVKGEFIHKEDVYEWFIKMSEKYGIHVVTYYPANAYRLNQDLQTYGGPKWVQPVRQGAMTLSPALKDIKELLLAGKVVFNNNKLFIWYLNNVRLVVADRNGNWLPTRQHKYRKIDGFAAFLNAHTEAMKLMTNEMESTGNVSFVSAKSLKGGH